MVRKWDFDFAAVRDHGGRSFEPKQWVFRQRFAGLAGMIRIIQTDADNFGGQNRRERSDAFQPGWFSIKRRGAKDIAAQAKDFAIENLRKKDLAALLKSANSCHKTAVCLAEQVVISQGQTRSATVERSCC